MKNLVKILVSVAVAAIALVSCNRESNYNAPEANAVTIRVHASADDLKADDETKTYIDTYQGKKNTILWGTGEYMKLALTAGESTTFANSTDTYANSFDGDNQAMFEFSVTPATASSYVYQGIYPASAVVANNNTNAANYKVNLPAIQNATASSYDPAAYIMVAKPETFNAVQSEWVASFRRATALNKITLKNVSSGVSISSVKITATNKKLAGGRHFDLSNGVGTDVYGTDATIEVKYASALTGTNVDVWFTSWDVEIAEAETLTIVAYTTDKKSYTKTITVPSGKTIKFKEGRLNTLVANMDGITPQNVASVDDGTYVILAKKDDSNYYALKGEVSGTRIASANYTGSLKEFSSADASIIWTIAASGSSYTIKNNGNYLGWESGSGNAAALVAEADYDADKCLMGIDDNGDGTFKIYVTVATDRILARNTSNAYFAFYTNTQYKDLVLVPATLLEQVATPTFDPAAGEVASGTTVNIECATSGATIYYTTDGTDPSTSSTQGSSVTITGTTTIKAIAVKSGMADSEIASATYTLTGATTNWELVTDFSSIASGGKYIFVNVQGTTSYYMKSSTAAAGSGTQCVALTLLPTDSGFVESDQMCVFLTGDTTNGFIVSNSEGKELFIKNTNNGLGFVDSGTTVNFYTDSDVAGYTLCGYDNASIPVLRYIGMNSTTNFRCYTSINSNVKTGEYVWYHYIGSGTSTSVTWNLESIAITTAPTKTTYTAGEIFDPAGMVVTAHFVDAADNTNTKDEEVTGYTVSPDGALAVTDDHVTITYQGKTTTQAITVNAAPVVTYDFETVAELNALVTSTSATYSGYLTNAVVSFAPAADTRVAIVKDATGSAMFYKSGHGLKQGQTYTGAIEVTAIKYNGLYSEVTAWDASFEGSGAVVAPETVALADLVGHYDDYQNAYVQVAGLTVSSQSGKNINVTDGANTYVVYDNTSSISVVAGEVITAVGTITKYQTTEEIKVWAAADVTVTTSLPKAITFTQPSAGGSFTVSVGGSNIASGATVAAGTTVNLVATPASGYNFTGWNVTGASVADASAASTSFEMGSSPVSISATFTEIGSTTHYYVKVTSTTSITDGDYLIVYENGNVAFDGGLSTFDGVGNTIGVTITSNGIEATSTVNAAKFTIESMTGGYSIQGASGKYITANSYSNRLDTSATAVANGISFDSSGNVLITVTLSDGTLTLKYNSASNQTRFRYYKSGQQSIQLYKLN